MSLIGAFIAGVTGVNAQTTKLDAISDNISNANTVGYKPTEVLFKTLVTRTDAPTELPGGPATGGAIPFNYAPGGVIPTPRQRMDLQGLITASQSTTDVAISGNGFFPVTSVNSVNPANGAVLQGAQLAVTRAGSFTMDKNGFLENSAGFVVMGVPAGSALPNSLTGLVPVKLDPGPAVQIAGAATTQVTLGGNLPATDAVGATENMTTSEFDAQGNAYAVNIQFTKTGTDSWSAQATSVAQTNASTPPVTGTVAGTPMALTFGTNGELTSGGTGSLGTITLSNGQTLSPTFNLVGANPNLTSVTQFDSTFAQTGAQQNGNTSGFRTGIQIDNNGMVNEVYSNGEVIPRFQIPVVTYVNPQGLEAETGNVWVATQASGTASIQAANTGPAGQIMPSTLEQSAVDLSTEFSDMIVSQSTYTANTKTITTADQMYQTLTQLR
jgi:flagellar hook protein FlgE